jgi:hypothetical protein
MQYLGLIATRRKTPMGPETIRSMWAINTLRPQIQYVLLPLPLPHLGTAGKPNDDPADVRNKNNSKLANNALQQPGRPFEENPLNTNRQS